MKLLVFCHEYPPIGGGASNGLFFLAQAWTAQGHEVTVVTSAFGNESMDEILKGVRVIRIACGRRYAEKGRVIEMLMYLFRSSLQASRWWKAVRPDLTIAFMTLPAAPAAWLMKRIYGVPYIVELRGGDVPGFYPQRLARLHFFTKPWILWFWRGAERVIANSEGLRKLALAADPRAIVQTLPNGVDAEIFRPGEKVSGSSVRLLFVGRLEEAQKNLGGLIDLIPDLAGVSLTVVGDGDDRAELEKRCARTGVADRVVFEGWVPKSELALKYRSADIFVSLSLWEGMPNSALEAMASGLPLILSDIEGHHELVEPGVNGELVCPARRDELLMIMNRLIRDGGLRAAMGRASRQRALDRHDWHRLAREHIR